MNNTLIEEQVGEFVVAEKGFTSVDICNAIKTAGTWIRNREVAAWLRNWTPPVGYGISKATVTTETGAVTQAGVYLPNSLSIADYTTTSQTAMKPDEFEKLHGISPVPDSVPLRDANDNGGDNGDDGGDGSQSASVGDRLRNMFKWPASSS